MKNKLFYEAPGTECFDVVLEKRFVDSEQGTTNNSTFQEQGKVTNIDDETWQWGN